MKVVLDTNVLVSAFISRKSIPAQVLSLFQEDGYTLLLSEAVLSELQRILHYPHLRQLYTYRDEQVAAFVRGIQVIALWIEPTETLSVVTEDETDNRFLELAVAGGARDVVTGDKKHLLKVRRYQAIDIVSPTEFLILTRQAGSV